MNSNKLVDISDVKNSPRSLANDVSASIGSVRALLDAIDDGLHLMMDKSTWGPYWPIMEYRGGHIRELLAITDGILSDMDRSQDQVVRAFYGKAN